MCFSCCFRKKMNQENNKKNNNKIQPIATERSQTKNQGSIMNKKNSSRKNVNGILKKDNMDTNNNDDSIITPCNDGNPTAMDNLENSSNLQDTKKNNSVTNDTYLNSPNSALTPGSVKFLTDDYLKHNIEVTNLDLFNKNKEKEDLEYDCSNSDYENEINDLQRNPKPKNIKKDININLNFTQINNNNNQYVIKNFNNNSNPLKAFDFNQNLNANGYDNIFALDKNTKEQKRKNSNRQKKNDNRGISQQNYGGSPLRNKRNQKEPEKKTRIVNPDSLSGSLIIDILDDQDSFAPNYTGEQKRVILGLLCQLDNCNEKLKLKGELESKLDFTELDTILQNLKFRRCALFYLILKSRSDENEWNKKYEDYIYSFKIFKNIIDKHKFLEGKYTKIYLQFDKEKNKCNITFDPIFNCKDQDFKVDVILEYEIGKKATDLYLNQYKGEYVLDYCDLRVLFTFKILDVLSKRYKKKLMVMAKVPKGVNFMEKSVENLSKTKVKNIKFASPKNTRHNLQTKITETDENDLSYSLIKTFKRQNNMNRSGQGIAYIVKDIQEPFNYKVFSGELELLISIRTHLFSLQSDRLNFDAFVDSLMCMYRHTFIYLQKCLEALFKNEQFDLDEPLDQIIKKNSQVEIHFNYYDDNIQQCITHNNTITNEGLIYYMENRNELNLAQSIIKDHHVREVICAQKLLNFYYNQYDLGLVNFPEFKAEIQLVKNHFIEGRQTLDYEENITKQIKKREELMDFNADYFIENLLKLIEARKQQCEIILVSNNLESPEVRQQIEEYRDLYGILHKNVPDIIDLNEEEKSDSQINGVKNAAIEECAAFESIYDCIKQNIQRLINFTKVHEAVKEIYADLKYWDEFKWLKE